jgi:3-deoxy-D-manno-octulosonic-acid transferase
MRDVSRLLREIYKALLLPVYGSMWLLYWLVPRGRANLERRLAMRLLPPRGRRAIWFHSASVGEVSTIAPVVAQVRKVRPGVPIVVTTMTPGGARRAAEKIGGAEVGLVPFDFPASMKRFVATLEPSCLIVGETEIWPNMVEETKKSGATVILVNGRISARSYPRYRLIRTLMRGVLNDFDLLLMRSEVDAGRIINLGADPKRVQVAGNTKYDILPEPLAAGRRLEVRAALGMGENLKIVTLGSAREGESEIVLGAVADPRLLRTCSVIIAPRHLELVSQIEQVCRGLGLRHRVLTDLVCGGGAVEAGEVLILARMGLLIEAYAASDIAIVGGTFRPFGGHNPLEPASQGCVTVVGPHIQNIRDDIEYLMERSAALVVERDSLAETLAGLLADPGRRKIIGDAAARAVMERKGIAARCVALMIERGVLPEE